MSREEACSQGVSNVRSNPLGGSCVAGPAARFPWDFERVEGSNAKPMGLAGTGSRFQLALIMIRRSWRHSERTRRLEVDVEESKINGTCQGRAAC